MKNYYTIISFFLVCTYSVSSQNINGIILDQSDDPVAFANVVLIESLDSTIAKVETTDETGTFVMHQIQKGSYYLSVSYIGLEDTNTEVFTVAKDNISLDPITMTSSSVQLETAVVTARRTLVEIKSDRTVFNVEGTINSAGDNAFGLLRKAPSVVIDNNNSVTVLGRAGVQFYLDGKRLPLSGDELQVYLESIPSDQIDRIDIITNPSAKYEAEGNAGIIDIILKRDKSLGLNGSLSSQFSQGFEHRGNGSFMLNYRNKKINVFGTLGYNFGNGYNAMYFDSQQNGFRLYNISKSVSTKEGPNLRLGTDYFLGKNSTIGFIVTAGRTGGDYLTENTNEITEDLLFEFGDTTPKDVDLPSDILDSILVSSQVGQAFNDMMTYNLNYAFRDKETSLNIDLDYGKFENSNSFFQPNVYYNNTRSSIIAERNYELNLPVDISIATAKIDYEVKALGGKLGIGSKYSKVSTDNTFEFSDKIADEFVINDFKSNNFTYDESVLAGYLTYNKAVTQKLKLTLGLRSEHTMTESILTAFREDLMEAPRDSSYISLFPNFGVSYVGGPRSIWSFSMGRRINRPDYNVLNPFRNQLTEIDFAIGNPALKPEIVNNVEVGYTLDYRFNFKLAFSRTQDQITRLIGTDDSDPKASFINWDNLAEQDIYSISASLPFQVTDKWNTYLSLAGSHISNRAKYPDGNVIDLEALSYNLFTQSTIKLPKGFVGEISCWYSGPGIWGGVFLYEPSYSLNIGLQKRFLDDKLNVKLAVQDVTRQAFWSGSSEFDGLLAYGQGEWDARRGSISVSYSFGNKEVKSSRKRETGIKDEKERVTEGEN